MLPSKIKEVAKENGVMTMENKPLARAIYEQVEIGDAIPADLFQAVAEVLAYVYKIKGKQIIIEECGGVQCHESQGSYYSYRHYRHCA